MSGAAANPGIFPRAPRFDYTHDAWGRLTSVTIYYTAMLQEPRGVYEYNGLNWRTVVLRDAPPNFAGYVTQKRTLYYDQRWRLLEERIDDDADAVPGDGDDRMAQMVWGERYIDDAVLRRESNNLTNDGSGTTWEDQWNYVTDAMFSVVAVIDASTAALVERTRYTPYGVARHCWPSDVDGDGASDSTDSGLILGASGKHIHESGYLAEADIDRSGRVTQADYALYSAKSALDEGQVGESGSGKADARVGVDGRNSDAEVTLYLSRRGSFDPTTGRRTQPNPMSVLDESSIEIGFSTIPIASHQPWLSECWEDSTSRQQCYQCCVDRRQDTFEGCQSDQQDGLRRCLRCSAWYSQIACHTREYARYRRCVDGADDEQDRCSDLCRENIPIW